MRTNYQNRIRASAWVSGILHLVLILMAWWFWPAFQFGPNPSGVPPIVVTLTPAPTPPTPRPQERQLVDVAAPANHPVQPTDLIAVQNSNAGDTVARSGDSMGPQVEEVSPIDSLGGSPGAGPSSPTAPAAPAPTPTTDAPTKDTKNENLPIESPVAVQTTTTPAPAEDVPATSMTMARADTPAATLNAKMEPQAKPVEASPAHAAAQTPQPAQPVGNDRPPAPTRGRAYSGVRHTGVKGFEALQDQIAPYLKQVQQRVELKWREALLTKYNGAQAVEALIDCQIGPDGRIVSITIQGTPEDRVYAALCKEAIEKAGPFGAFPFQVPEIYRNRNLEIRWSFNFL